MLRGATHDDPRLCFTEQHRIQSRSVELAQIDVRAKPIMSSCLLHHSPRSRQMMRWRDQALLHNSAVADDLEWCNPKSVLPTPNPFAGCLPGLESVNPFQVFAPAKFVAEFAQQ